jgi:hypothetical protein
VGKTRRDKWRNNRIREILNQVPILNYTERRSIQWYGHVVRMQDYRKLKQAMEARREKRRGRGRPRKTWEGCVGRCGHEQRNDFSRFEETGSR